MYLYVSQLWYWAYWYFDGMVVVRYLRCQVYSHPGVGIRFDVFLCQFVQLDEARACFQILPEAHKVAPLDILLV